MTGVPRVSLLALCGTTVFSSGFAVAHLRISAAGVALLVFSLSLDRREPHRPPHRWDGHVCRSSPAGSHGAELPLYHAASRGARVGHPCRLDLAVARMSGTGFGRAADAAALAGIARGRAEPVTGRRRRKGEVAIPTFYPLFIACFHGRDLGLISDGQHAPNHGVMALSWRLDSLLSYQ